MLLKGFAAAVAAFVLAMPLAHAAAPVPVAPGQRIDLKVLLVSADGSEPGYGAWKAELDREGVPYDAFVAYNGQAKVATLDDAKLADYPAGHARYQAVILATGDLGHSVANADGTVSYLSALTDAEWASLGRFERTFGIRQLSDYTAPSPAHGLNSTGGASQDGVAATLTATGKLAFPYLTGPVTVADDDPGAAETFGYHATPVDGANWQSLLTAPDGTSFLGIYTHPDDGREEMVMTVASNQFQNHNQLLRHGMLTWVTRGVFTGYQRDYLELQVDDLFLGDDAWDPQTHSTSYDPAAASRVTPADVDHAIAWSRQAGLRLDMVFNGGGSAVYTQDTGTADPLVAKFADPAARATFGWINHTYDHPNLDCSTASFIAKEIRDNLSWARAHALPADPAELVTGEHSGLANTRPGNPGTIDPPAFDDVVPAATGGAVPGGTYDYAVTARTPAGETVASESDAIAVGTAGSTTNSVTVSFNAVCHAIAYDVYRRPTSTTAWTRVAELAGNPAAPTDDGSAPLSLSIADTLAAGTAVQSPATNQAALAPYGQNPNFLAGITGAGVTYVATDASKSYPPAAGFSPFPRYPSNVYYNVSKQGQQLDEYNWIYVDPPTGGCVPITGITTCRATPATWPDYVTSETRIMFNHVAGNDPRPHFFHQSNLANYNPALPETDPAQGGILYPVIDALVGRYRADFNTPLVQLTPTQIAQTLAQQAAWTANRAQVTAYVQDGVIHVHNGNAAAVDVPLTGTTAGSRYGGQNSGWVTLAAGADQAFMPADPANTGAPNAVRSGDTLTADHGTWAGTAPISFGYQWQRCDARGANCASVAGATADQYALADADVGHTLRVVVQAGNWISSVSQASSAASEVVAAKPQHESGSQGSSGSPGPSAARPGSPASPRRAAERPKLALTRLSMTPRRFAVSHRRALQGTKLDGARISWRLNRAATVRLTFQRKAHRRWVRVGRVSRLAAAGTGVVRFRGRFGSELLAPRRYRVVVRAIDGREHTADRRLAFRVVRG